MKTSSVFFPPPASFKYDYFDKPDIIKDLQISNFNLQPGKITVMKRLFLFSLIILACAAINIKVFAGGIYNRLSDPLATAETKALYENLHKLAPKGYLFGHQDDLAYGVNWRYKKNHSDVKEACGDYPALYGWDMSGIEKNPAGKNIDGVPFDKMCEYIKEGYNRGGVVTLSWHVNNPLTEGNAWDTTPGAVNAVLPGGEKYEAFKKWLDNAAAFILSLKGKNNELIPILFRPFHELTGNWFWWCRNTCTARQFKELWRYTFNYLIKVKHCHNLIFVYNTSDNFNTADEFLERFPGNDVADIISFDTYQYNDPKTDNSFIKGTAARLDILDSVALQTGKLTAIAETGYEAIPYATWWTGILQNAIGSHSVSYVLVWRNHGYNESMKKMHYYAPYKGQLSEKDFIRFYQDKKTFFEKDIAAVKIYKKTGYRIKKG